MPYKDAKRGNEKSWECPDGRAGEFLAVRMKTHKVQVGENQHQSIFCWHFWHPSQPNFILIGLTVRSMQSGWAFNRARQLALYLIWSVDCDQ